MTKIPRFGTEQEMREFWDIHDSAEYFEDMDDDEVSVEFKRDKGVLVIPLGEGLARSVRGITLEEGVSSNVFQKLDRWMYRGEGKIERISPDRMRCLLKMIYEARSIAHRLTVGVGRDYDVEAILDTEEVGGLINEAEHFVDKITRDIMHREFAGLVDAGGYRMRGGE